MRSLAISSLLCSVLMLTHFAAGQSLPSKIRGYRVYDAAVTIVNANDLTVNSREPDAVVKLLDPRIVSIGVFGAVIRIGAEVTATKQSGRVDFMTFDDIRVNGIAIEVEEYANPFKFREDEIATLPAPAIISIKTANLAIAAYKEIVESKRDWAVTGTVFVFGKFKKFGISFKCVVPVKIDLTIKNPLKKT